MGRKLRRYKMNELPKLDQTRVDVVNALLAYLPSTPFEAGFKTTLREAVEPLVHVDLDFWLDRLDVLDGREMRELLGDVTCVSVVELPPTPNPMLIEVDLCMAQRAIDRMLGGEASDVDAKRPLSEIERGVFSFLIIRMLALLQHTGDEHQVGLRQKALCSSSAEVATLVHTDRLWVCCHFKLFLGTAVGFCRFYLPEELITSELFTAHPEPGPAKSRALRNIAKRTPLITTLATHLDVEIGRIPLEMEDLAGLEEGDIVVVENPDVALQAGTLAGQVQCRVGEGRHGIILGNVVVGETGRYEVEIEQILPLEVPEAAAELHPPDAEYESAEHEMNEEYAKRRSAPLNDASYQQASQAARAKRVRSGALAPLPTRHAPTSLPGSEHSDGEEYESHEGGDAGYAEGEQEEPLAESAQLLSDVTVAMVVELGRVNVTAADVVGLRPGQVIELARAPGDAVDLVVDNKRIGQGELVEIEGELGVRILSLVQ